ncbi:MAG: signal peptidase I [Candidatus Zixiibacteriota bacterium]
MSKRRSWLAGILSIFVPGLGHLYAGKLTRAIIWFLTFLIIINLIFLLFINADWGKYSVIIPICIFLLTYLCVIIDAIICSQRFTVEYQLQAFNRWYIYIIVIIVYLFANDYLLPAGRNYESLKMPSTSMENSLFIGDYFIVDTTAYKTNPPERNELVDIKYPIDRKTRYIKRCIGLPGDTIEIIDKQVFVNGMAFNEMTSIKNIDDRTNPKRDNYGPYEVPPKNYFVLGDNRDNSSDSRYWGTVPRDLIIGTPVKIFWSSELGRLGKLIK